MNSVIQNIQRRASEKERTIVLPETNDVRVLKAATFLAEEEISQVIAVGDADKLQDQANRNDLKLSDKIQFRLPENDPDREAMALHLLERRKHTGITSDEAYQQMANPLYFGAGLVAIGEADGCVAGSVATTGDVIRAAIHVIGLRPGIQTISSIFLMALKEGSTLTYADCGVVPYPDAAELSDIAIESARTHRLLTGEQPKVALLSFSTKGSASHERVELVNEALQHITEKAPELPVDGELQFDAAYVPEVAQRKAPDSPVAGRANVFIFPNLDAGNIAYKITERLAGAEATGPILQGLDKPMMDLSRGCRWQDVVNAACVGIVMANSE